MMAILLSCTMSGSLLRSHLLCCSKTSKCLLNLMFITQRIIGAQKRVRVCYTSLTVFLVPMCTPLRHILGLDKNHFALAHFDVFAAHRCESVLQRRPTQYCNLDAMYPCTCKDGDLLYKALHYKHGVHWTLAARFSEDPRASGSPAINVEPPFPDPSLLA